MNSRQVSGSAHTRRAVVVVRSLLAPLVILSTQAGAGPAPGAAEGAATAQAQAGFVPHVAWTLPFVLILLAIATLPLVGRASHWWEANRNKLAVAVGLGLVVLAYYGLRGAGFGHAAPGLASMVAVLEHAILRDYVPFMVLLFSLYVVAGGLRLTGDLVATPLVNASFLAIGAVLASLIGTTGASMVLIRPLLQTNGERKHVRHTVVFFIFLVSNVGGLLLPLGDPPLFLGYLQGVPFLWTLGLWKPWAFCVVTLLAIYLVWDTLAHRRETAKDLAADERTREPLRVHGKINAIWLLGIVLAVARIVPGQAFPGTHLIVSEFVREGVMLALAGLSLATTPRGLRRAGEFNYAAIFEVAALFLGIFLTMQVPIEILQARGRELGLSDPAHFFWATGTLSSFLDNAPTYLVFLETARSLPVAEGVRAVTLFRGSVPENLLVAISLGAVFMGANTYIGNGPNFMVKAIAEGRGVKMPSFFGYMAYSVAVLIPLYAVMCWVFVG